MKKLSITKKSKLAFGVGGVWYKFHILSLSMVLVNMMVDDELFLTVLGGLSYGWMESAFLIMSVTFPVMNIKFFRVLPLNNSDITDIIAINLMQSSAFMAAGQLILLIVTDVSAIPYFLSMDCALFGISSLLIPWYMKDRFTYTTIKNRNADEKEARKSSVRVGCITIGYMIIMIAVTIAMTYRAVISGNLSEDMIMLLIIAGAGLLLGGVVCKYSKKIKNAFMN